VASWGTQVGLGASWGAALGQDVSSHAPHHGPLSWCPLEALFACLLAHPSSCPNKLKVMSCFLLACHGARHVCVCCANAATNTCLKSQNQKHTCGPWLQPQATSHVCLFAGCFGLLGFQHCHVKPCANHQLQQLPPKVPKWGAGAARLLHGGNVPHVSSHVLNWGRGPLGKQHCEAWQVATGCPNLATTLLQ
jgi:hypothetical protein